MPKFSIHIPDGPNRTLCGKNRLKDTARGVEYWRTRELSIIKPNQCIEESTCKACWRVDDARQVRDYQRECREANINPNTLQPLPKVAR